MFFTSNNQLLLKKVLSLALGAGALVLASLFFSVSVNVPEAFALCNESTGEGCGPGEILPKACNDDQDNDGDGRFDYETDGTGDPGCASVSDNNELTSIQCDDGLDNDSDGKIDWRTSGGDVDCSSLTDNLEAAPITRTITVNIPALGNNYDNYSRGQIVVSPGGTCTSSSCQYSATDGQVLQLTAQPAPTDNLGDSYFTGWSGDCSGTSATVSVLMNANKNCTANFHRHNAPYPTSHTFTVSNVGNASGVATFQTLGSPTTCTLPAGGSCVYTVQDDQYISQIIATPGSGASATYPNVNESCFQDGNVFIQHNRRCTVNFAAALPTCTVNPSSMATGVTTRATAAGGNGTYTWNTGGGTSCATGATCDTSYSTNGAKTITVTSNGQTGTCSVNVGAPTCSASPGLVPTGTNTILTASGSSGPYLWNTGGGTTCPSGNTCTTSYGSTGQKTVTVTGSNGVPGTCTVNVQNGDSTIYVHSDLATTFSYTGPSPQSNQSLVASTTKNFPAAPGTYTITPAPQPNCTFVVNPSNTQSLGASSPISFNIDYTCNGTPPPPIGPFACQANPSSVPPGTNTIVTAYNGVGPYTWTFPGGYYESGPRTTAAASTNVQYQFPGSYTASVSDSASHSATCPIGVSAYPPPPNPGFAMDFFVTSPQNGIYGSTEGSITIEHGTNILLEWDSNDTSPTGCTASGDWSGPKVRNTYASESRGPLTSPPTPKVYTLRCYGFATEYGGAEPYIEKTIAVHITTATKGTLNVTSNVPTTWSFTGPTPPLAQVTPATSGGPYIVTPGTYTIVPQALAGYATPNPSYVAAQTVGAGGTRTYNLVYTPLPSATVDIKANGSNGPITLVSGTPVMLTWGTQNIQTGSCVGSGATWWNGNKTDNGTSTSGAILASRTYTLTCTSSFTGNPVADSVDVLMVPAQCEDTIDNGDAEDTLIDMNDPGCSDPKDNDETNGNYECSDNSNNNDGDNLIDYDGADNNVNTTVDNDPGCTGPTDNTELDFTIITECNDGLDNNGNNLIDECDSPTDPRELSDPDIEEI